MPIRAIHCGRNKLTWKLLQSLQRPLRSYQPWGCYLRRSDPSSLRVRERRRSLRTAHRSAYVPWCRSCRRKQDLLPYCRDGGFYPFHRRKQRRSTSCRSHCTTSCKCLQRDAGISKLKDKSGPDRRGLCQMLRNVGFILLGEII